jgi:ketosteroid isomerase-like protein
MMEKNSESKRLVEAIFSGQLDLFDTLSEDAAWHIAGRRSFEGKQVIASELLAPMAALMASMGRGVLTNIIAEGDQVVVEWYAVDRMTKRGEPYNSTYCMIFRVEEGKIVHITEYADLALVERVLPEISEAPGT